MAGIGFFLLVCIPLSGFLLVLFLSYLKGLRFLALYAGLVPSCAGWGTLAGLLHFPTFTGGGKDVVIGFVSGGVLGSVVGVGLAFGLSRLRSHA